MPLADVHAPAQQTLHVIAPAKINLYLAIAGMRPDGFHELVSLFERVDLADTIELTPHAAGVLCECSDASLPTDDKNLVVQAAELIQTHCHVTDGVRITIEKQIPIGAGLGGGSSDAAAVLCALNQWWSLNLTRNDLLQLARRVGSDVPFFLADTPWALGLGRGDVIVPLPPPHRTLWHVLVTPGVSLSTERVYGEWDRLGSASGAANWLRLTRLVQSLMEDTSLDRISRSLANQLTPAAIQLAPEVQQADECLRATGAPAVIMSGSGPTVVAIGDRCEQMQQVADRVRELHPTWRVVVTKTY